jgi:hypothetical protein|tara:strand:- start:15235 stop:15414 length:180 start_codon:yes stop_codon:yes gene_type:complete
MNRKIQYGDSVTGNLQKNTWTFRMEDDLWVKAGRFAIIDVTKLSLTELQKLENFITQEL